MCSPPAPAVHDTCSPPAVTTSEMCSPPAVTTSEKCSPPAPAAHDTGSPPAVTKQARFACRGGPAVVSSPPLPFSQTTDRQRRSVRTQNQKNKKQTLLQEEERVKSEGQPAPAAGKRKKEIGHRHNQTQTQTQTRQQSDWAGQTVKTPTLHKQSTHARTLHRLRLTTVQNGAGRFGCITSVLARLVVVCPPGPQWCLLLLLCSGLCLYDGGKTGTKRKKDQERSKWKVTRTRWRPQQMGARTRDKVTRTRWRPQKKGAWKGQGDKDEVEASEEGCLEKGKATRTRWRPQQKGARTWNSGKRQGRGGGLTQKGAWNSGKAEAWRAEQASWVARKRRRE
ncbi:hypothetical protein HDK77DRAFT_451524 [Phyllosticta capitalensis]